jgi:subtilisin family serine protease
MIVNSDGAEEIRRELGENPSPEAIFEYSQHKFGVVAPQILDLYTRYNHVVTLKNYECQDNFYDEMESSGSRGYVPSRAVCCVDRMPVCRSTVYDITPLEAARLEQDPRVLAVEPDPELLGHRVKPLGYEFSNGWDKSGTVTNNMKNWGLLRCWNREQIAGWGSNGTANQTAGITTTSSGKNVDVVVFDGNLLAAHPEFAVNSDGTGGTRVNQFNWWSLNPIVTGQPAGTYNYSAGSAGNNGHGIHVAGIMAGNTCGWAQDANIYQISPYGEQTNGSTTPSLTQLVNYIRTWHGQKTINPATGRRNPTVVNMSFGSFGNFFPRDGGGSGILYSNELRYRGVVTPYPASPPAGQTSLQAAYNGNWALQQWYDAGVQMFKDYIDLYGVILYFWTNQDAAAEAAILDGANEGIIWVAAAGNQYNEAGMVNTSADFDNYMNVAAFIIGTVVIYSQKFHNRLPAPAAAQRNNYGDPNYEQICAVGNISTLVNESLSITSSAGSKVNMWAPGENIMSSYNSGVSDPRNAAFFLNKLTGTSMASPQVAGVLACVAEQYPNMTQAEAIEYIEYFCERGIVPDLGIPLPPGPVSYYGLRGAPNYFLNYYQDRPILGNTWPQKRSWLRPASGAVYPRNSQQYRPVQ